MKAWSLILSKEVSVTKEGDHYVDQDGNLWNDFELACLQEDTDWQQVRIQAAIAAMQGLVSNEIHLNHADKVAEEKGINTSTFLAKCAIDCADALVAELKHSDDVYAECRRMDAINTASVCENMTKIQNELQKKDDNADV